MDNLGRQSVDYGCDPIGNGKYRMVPSGDIVDAVERGKRLVQIRMDTPTNECLGMSWQKLALMQGGLSTLDVTRPKKKKK